MSEAQYGEAVFKRVRSMQEAAMVILTPEGDQDTPQRWDIETPYLIDRIDQHFALSESSWVLDYGTGIGRLARPLIERFNCHVVGVDISNNMRMFAVAYVDSDKFIPCSPEALAGLQRVTGVQFDLAITCWVLQHCQSPQDDLQRIHSCLRDDGHLFVVEQHERSVPMAKPVDPQRPFYNDMVNVQEIIEKLFKREEIGALDPTIIPPELANRSYWGRFSKIIPETVAATDGH